MEVTLKSLSGEERSLTSLWKDRSIVICFLRHLGCRFCRQQISTLNKIFAQLKKESIGLVAVSLGSVKAANEFVKRSEFQGEFYVDDSTETNVNKMNEAKQSFAYKMLKLKKGANLVRNKNTTQKSEKAKKSGFTDWKDLADSDEINIWPGDIFQIGGVFVVGPGNVCDYAYRSEYAGDHPLIRDVLVAATGKQPNGSDYVYPATKQWFEKLRGFEKVDSKKPLIRSRKDSKSHTKRSIEVDKSSLSSIFSGSIVVVFASLAIVAVALAGAFSIYFYRNEFSELEMTLIGTFISAFVVLISLFSWSHRLFSNSEPAFELPVPKLLTPKEIDAKVLSKGGLECDCGAVVTQLPFLEQDIESSTKESTGDTRVRGMTWDSSMGPNEFQTILCYVRNFLAKAHPAVGRGGPVCPFVPKSLRKDCLYLGVVRFPPNVSVRKSHIVNLVKRFASKFESLPPTTGRARQFKAIVLIFPDIALEDAHELIDGTQLECKADFVSRGLMVGEFHLKNNASGLRNKKFYPLRTPVPCLAMRHMVPTDLAFLDVQSYEPKLRLKFLRSFLSVFGEDKSAKKKPEVKKARDALRELLGS
eukprot:g2117.t1